MRRLLFALIAIVFAAPIAGCGSDKDRGINKDRDKPRTPATEKQAE